MLDTLPLECQGTFRVAFESENSSRHSKRATKCLRREPSNVNVVGSASSPISMKHEFVTGTTTMNG